jgi:hypothetical protein
LSIHYQKVLKAITVTTISNLIVYFDSTVMRFQETSTASITEKDFSKTVM